VKALDADKLWAALQGGARWQDDPAPVALRTQPAPAGPFQIEAAAEPLAVSASAWLGRGRLAADDQVVGRIRPQAKPCQQVFVHPETARRYALNHG